MFNTRKTVDQTQLGLVYERRLDAVNSLRALVYDGHRNTEQFQAIPVAPQASPLHPGGVIALGRDYRGADLRWTAQTQLGEAPLTVVAGLTYDDLVGAATRLPELHRHRPSASKGRCGATRPTTSGTSTNTCRRRGRSPRAGRCTAGCATATSASRPRTTTSSAPIRTTAAA